MKRTIQVTMNESQSDLDKIRKDAGNAALQFGDVVVFKPSMIGRSDVAANGIFFSRESLEQAAATFVGKAINFDHDAEKASEQVGRIFDAFTDTVDDTTFLYVKFYAIKTDGDADLHAKLLNRQHREQSMGIDIQAAHCTSCRQDVIPTDGKCPEHCADDGYSYIVDSFTGDHVSYVGRAAVESAGVTMAKDDSMIGRDAPIVNEDVTFFRDLAATEFKKWWGLNNRNTSGDALDTLVAKLSAKEMIRLAQIEHATFTKVLPDGKQISEVREDEQSPILRTEEEIRESFRRQS